MLHKPGKGADGAVLEMYYEVSREAEAFGLTVIDETLSLGPGEDFRNREIKSNLALMLEFILKQEERFSEGGLLSFSGRKTMLKLRHLAQVAFEQGRRFITTKELDRRELDERQLPGPILVRRP